MESLVYAELLFGCCCFHGIISVSHGSVTRMISRHFCCQCYFCGLVCSCQTVVLLSASVIKKDVFVSLASCSYLWVTCATTNYCVNVFGIFYRHFKILSLKVFSYYRKARNCKIVSQVLWLARGNYQGYGFMVAERDATRGWGRATIMGCSKSVMFLGYCRNAS